MADVPDSNASPDAAIVIKNDGRALSGQWSVAADGAGVPRSLREARAASWERAG
jgi:hypothetical protein